MRRARDPQRPFNWLKQPDPNDLEASYRKPIPRSEIQRLGVKAAVVVAAFFWFRGAVFAATDLAGLAFAVGAVLLVSGVVDVFAARRNEIEQIFLTKRTHQIYARLAMITTGVVLVGFAVVRDVL